MSHARSGKNTTEGVLDAHPPSKCPDIQEASFKCKTADYDEAAGTGIERAFSPLACPSQADTAIADLSCPHDVISRQTCTTHQTRPTMPMPKITIGLDAASRAKYKSSLAAQLSFFSITQTDDPIPRTNFSFSDQREVQTSVGVRF